MFNPLRGCPVYTTEPWVDTHGYSNSSPSGLPYRCLILLFNWHFVLFTWGFTPGYCMSLLRSSGYNKRLSIFVKKETSPYPNVIKLRVFPSFRSAIPSASNS